MDKKNILIVEDEVKLARFIELELQYEGYRVDSAHDGRTGFEMFQENNYDLVLLDLMLPEINGMELLRRIRKSSEATPVIMLTAKGEVMDKVSGLDAGADDYITKPFAIEELLARMRVALKKRYQPEYSDISEQNILTLMNLTIDTQKRTVKVDDTDVDLTKTEFELLVYLVKNKGIVLTREQIMNQVWGYNYLGETNVVDVYIRYLRIKIDDKFNTKFIHTIRGVGYFAKDRDEVKA